MKKKKWKIREKSLLWYFKEIATSLWIFVIIGIMILVIIAGIILKINKSEWIICIILFAIVIGSELFNTSIETIVDMVMPEKNEKAKIAKDVSAGAVLVVAIGAAIIGLVIFVPRILNILI